ncbi:hypothetical protein ACO0LM_00790 [Undibacterium sp. Di26W]|uniref:hypothetical protein n=1 Tax=Undibacterium sp. Di26W TaxID=3413035 RepID=UPI003BF30DF6
MKALFGGQRRIVGQPPAQATGVARRHHPTEAVIQSALTAAGFDTAVVADAHAPAGGRKGC